MKVEVAGDPEVLRRLLLKMAPRMEARQPGITAQLEQADLTMPMRMATRAGEVIAIQVEPHSGSSSIKVSVHPPARPLGRIRGPFWRWRTRLMVTWVLRGVKRAVAKEAKSS